MSTILISASFKLSSPVHITGDRVAFGLDKALHLDPRDDKRPVIPASTIKGWLRHQVDAILQAAGYLTCGSVQPGRMCTDNPCLACKYFGNTRHPSPLLFKDAVVENHLVDYRMGVGLSRHRKAALEDLLFSTETASGTGFKALIAGILPAEDEAREIIALVYLACKAGFAVGSTRSRGLGCIETSAFEATIDESRVSSEAIETAAKKVWHRK